jgi:phage pi2 protein 07
MSRLINNFALAHKTPMKERRKDSNIVLLHTDFTKKFQVESAGIFYFAFSEKSV